MSTDPDPLPPAFDPLPLLCLKWNDETRDDQRIESMLVIPSETQNHERYLRYLEARPNPDLALPSLALIIIKY